MMEPEPEPEPEPKPEPEPELKVQPEPEPEPEPVAQGDSVIQPRPEMQSPAGEVGDGEGDDESTRLRRKIGAFLGDIPIGRPGSEGSTSERGFDATPLVEFAEREALHEASAEEIYCMFVEAKTREAEDQLMGEMRATGSSASELVGATPHASSQGAEARPVAQQTEYAALYAAGAVRIRKQQQQQQARKSTKIAQLKKERDDALWASSQLQMRCDATDEILQSLQEQAAHDEASLLAAMEEIQELRDKLLASDTARDAIAGELGRTKHELRNCQNQLEGVEMELQMETSLAQSLSRENRRLATEHAAAVKGCETAKASEAAMEKKLREVEHIVPKYLEQQRGCTRQIVSETTVMAAATPAGDLDSTSMLGGTHNTSIRTLAFMHGLGFHRRRAAAAAAAAAAPAPSSATTTATEELDEPPDEPPQSPSQGSIDDSTSNDSDILLVSSDDDDDPPCNPLSRSWTVTTDHSTTIAADPIGSDLVGVLGWEQLNDGELDSLSFLDKIHMQRALKREKKIVWADHSDGSFELATVHPYSLHPEFSLHRKVRSRAEKREEKKAKEEARREKRKHRRRTDKHSKKSSSDDGGGGNTRREFAQHRSKTKSRSVDKLNHRLHDAVAPWSNGGAHIVCSDDGSCDMLNRCACVLTGPAGEKIHLVADGTGKGSYEIGRKTVPVGIDSPKVHRQHVRVAFINGCWSAQKLGKNPGYVLPKLVRKRDGTGWHGISSADEIDLADRDSNEAIGSEEEEGDDDDDDDDDCDDEDYEMNEQEDLRSLQIRIEDEPAWIRLVDGDRLYCSKLERHLSVLFELVPSTYSTMKTETEDCEGSLGKMECGTSLSASKLQPAQHLMERTQPPDWRLKLPARGSLRLQNPPTDAQYLEYSSVESGDWRQALPAKGSLRLQKLR